ncbi:MAG: NADH-quinone oxidoreductase subunit NuoH [FCB group bacterium]|nr:NADH-quinone oxidoreductase subunit NuoH [FCB group bacterium]
MFENLTSLEWLLWLILAGLLLFGLMAVNALAAVYAERKLSAFMQDRLGPMGQGAGFHAGKWGMLQTVADALKLILKEDIIPRAADRRLFIIAPYIIFIGAFIAIAALPFSEYIQVIDINLGIFYLLAVCSLGVVGLITAGWASDNKWSLYGALRSAAQIVSYEIPAALSIIVVVMLTSTLDLQGIIRSQEGVIWGILPNWIIFNNPFAFLAFFIYFISGVAETNRTPFDIPEAESELVAGFHTEYSGMRWAFFFLSEYANMFIVCGIATVAFLGGWQSPVPGFMDSGAWGLFWFFGKVLFLIFVMIWFRWTFPRLRVDQLMGVAWKVLLPLALLNIFGVGLWSLYIG